MSRPPHSSLPKQPVSTLPASNPLAGMQPDPALDALTRTAARVCQAPIALITRLDATTQWHTSRYGCAIPSLPIEASICSHHPSGVGFWEVPDLYQVPHLKPLASFAGPPGLRYYGGVPLRSQHPGSHLPQIHGSLCILDHHPRTLSPDQAEALETLAAQVVAQLELRQLLAENQSRTRRIESALRDSEAFYHSLVENLPQNIFRKNPGGQFTFANQRFCETVGLPLDAIIGKTDADIFPLSLAQKYQQDDQRVLQSGVPYETTEAHQSADHEKLYVHVVKTPVFDSAGTVIGIQGIFWDVTERLRMEEELAAERDLLRSLLDNVPDSIYFKDADSRFIKLSKALVEKLGVQNADEALAKTDRDFFDNEHAQKALADEQRIILTGQPLIGQPELEIWKNGKRTWVLTTKMPLRNKDGAIVGTMGISKDITALKESEEQLALARDAALESVRLKSEFLANMSHEIRTPMNAVIGMTGLLLDTQLDSNQREFTETIRTSADSLLNIINDILDFSRIEAGKLPMECIDFHLNDVVEGAVDLLAERAQAKQIELASWIQPDVPRFLRGDPGRLRQVLINLLSNAVKFTERGEVVVTVSLEQDLADQAFIKVTVQDTGIGIPEEAQPRLFQAFTQADGSLTRRYGGTGLGLAICRQLVDLMGGTIHFQSNPGQGSIFAFTAVLAKQPGRRSAEQLPCADLTGLRVLVVDDNAANRLIVHHQVISWRMRNGCASSGPEALAILQKAADQGDPYNLVILDMQMPAMNGLEVAQAIHSNPLLSHTKVVILTSLGFHPHQTVLRTAGIDAYLVKPVKQSRLFDTLANVMNAAKGSASAAPDPSPLASPGTGISPPAARPAIRVLLAEDNAVNQKVALRQLAKLGYNADAVATGTEALQALARIPYNVVIMDCQMPDMDGYEASRQLRQREASGQLGRQSPCYIVAMTANALTGDREQCLSAGMNDYLSKPVRLEDLRQALLRAEANFANPCPSTGSTPPRLQDRIPPVDPDVLKTLRDLKTDGEPDPLCELISLFLEHTPPRITAIEKAIRDTDPAALEAAAHSMKGSSSNLGAARFAELCQQLINAAKQNRLEDAPPLFSQLKDELAQLTLYLLQEQKRSQ